MIVTLDGPAGAGKSSIARLVATELGFEFLDTGAMYRAMTAGAMRAGIELTDVDALVQFADAVTLQWKDDHVFLDDEDFTDLIRTPEVTKSIRYIADEPTIRAKLSAQQRRIAVGRDIVTEGRDQGTEVFPDAECKIFLTASPNERARRRQRQLAEQGRDVSFDDVLIAQNKRDLEDRQRPVGRLRAASDAVVIQTDNLNNEEVLKSVLVVVRSQRSADAP